MCGWCAANAFLTNRKQIAVVTDMTGANRENGPCLSFKLKRNTGFHIDTVLQEHCSLQKKLHSNSHSLSTSCKRFCVIGNKQSYIWPLTIHVLQGFHWTRGSSGPDTIISVALQRALAHCDPASMLRCKNIMLWIGIKITSAVNLLLTSQATIVSNSIWLSFHQPILREKRKN